VGRQILSLNDKFKTIEDYRNSMEVAAVGINSNADSKLKELKYERSDTKK